MELLLTFERHHLWYQHKCEPVLASAPFTSFLPGTSSTSSFLCSSPLTYLSIVLAMRARNITKLRRHKEKYIFCKLPCCFCVGLLLPYLIITLTNRWYFALFCQPFEPVGQASSLIMHFHTTIFSVDYNTKNITDTINMTAILVTIIVSKFPKVLQVFLIPFTWLLFPLFPFQSSRVPLLLQNPITAFL